MSRRRSRRRPPAEPITVAIEALSHDGRGVARVDGKAVFVHGALPGEQVTCQYRAQRRQYDEADTVEVLAPSAERVTPQCPHFGQCGGCSLQHLIPAGQRAAKRQTLIDAFARIGQVQADEIWPDLVGASPWGYRRKARLGVKYVAKKGRVLVGFRERGSAFVADLQGCPVLEPSIGALLPALAECIGALSIRERLPQIEVAMDDARLVLVLRVLDPPDAADRARLTAFAREHAVTLYLQPGGPDTVVPLDQPVDLAYALPDQGLTLGFGPLDFTQVNSDINRQMVSRALELLAPGAGERVLDLFCGVGNFTLPLATGGAQVVGVEGAPELVARAQDNARRNGLDTVTFHCANLFEPLAEAPWRQGCYDKALLDPPRSGAQEVLPELARLGVKRVVYVSCYPGTLARDAGLLVREHGYRLRGAGIMDMFPHTAHVESIALFERA